MAVKQVRVSDLSGRQADKDQFAKLIVHEHPQYQGPITLDVLPEELGELPESDQYVSIEVVGPGERSGQRALLSLDRFNRLAAGGDMPARGVRKCDHAAYRRSWSRLATERWRMSCASHCPLVETLDRCLAVVGRCAGAV